MNLESGHDRDEQRLAGLIRQGGPRPQPPAAVRDAVRAAAHAEWRAVVAARKATRRTMMRWSLATAASVAAIAGWLSWPTLMPAPSTVGTLARVNGPVELDEGGLFGGAVPARAGAVIATGQELRSGAGGRAALDLDGVSLRMDEGTVIAMLAPDRVELKRGAVYVDAGQAAGPLLVETALGSVAHVGTQYETRLADSALRVRVREGRVRVGDGERTLEGAAGEQLTILADGKVRREAVAGYGADWAWAGDIAPSFDIENRRLDEFLRWIGRESGREVTYGSRAAEAEAAKLVLRGSVKGLKPEQALAAVMATTRFEYRTAPGRLVVELHPAGP